MKSSHDLDVRIEFDVTSETAMDELGRRLGSTIPDGTTVALIGPLGAGKTRLVQGIAQELGVARELVTSPTFVICQQYQGGKTIYHLDLYRIADEDAFWELGPQEWFESAGVTLVEWADRFIDCLPRERLEIMIGITGEHSRAVELRARGHELGRRLEERLKDATPSEGLSMHLPGTRPGADSDRA